MAKYNDLTAGQSEACINRMGGWGNFLRFIGGEGKVVFETILTLIRTVRIAAQPAVTTSEEYFAEAGVGLAISSFPNQFYDLEVPATGDDELGMHRLVENSHNEAILNELGYKAEISVAQFRAFLAMNRGSEEHFIFFLRGKDGHLWVVYPEWDTVLYGGWYVRALPVEFSQTWFAEGVVVSRKVA